MATTSEVDVGMDDIARILTEERQKMIKAKQAGSSASATLAAIPTVYSDVIATINAYGTTNAYEAAVKAKLAKMTTEFLALKAKADQVSSLDLNT